MLQFRNKVINGDEITFDVGIDFTGTGMLYETVGVYNETNLDDYYDYFGGFQIVWNPSLVKNMDMTAQNKRYSSYYERPNDNELITARIITDGAVVNTRVYDAISNSNQSLYFLAYPNRSVVQRFYLNKNDFSTTPAGWGKINVSRYSFAGTMNGGVPTTKGDGSPLDPGNYYPDMTWFYRDDATLNPFWVFMQVKITIQSGQSMPSSIHDLMHFFAPDETPLPDSFFTIKQGWSGEAIPVQYSEIEYSPAGAGAGGDSGAGAGGDSGGSTGAFFDITYDGQLSGVRAMAFQDLDSAGKLYCYATAEYGSSCLYFGTDLHDFASFDKRVILDENSQPLSLEGVPTALSMDPSDGSVYVGTITGKLYHVTYNSGDLNSVAKEVADGVERVKKAHWDLDRSECLFEVDGEIKSATVDGAGFDVQSRHSLVSGARVVSFESSPDGIAVVYRKQDYSFDRMFVEGTNWASPKQSIDLVESVRTARSFVYNRRLQMWVAGFEDSSSTSIADLL